MKKKKNFGPSFGEFIEISARRGKISTSEDLFTAQNWGEPKGEAEKLKNFHRISRWRFVPIYVFLIGAFSLLLARAFDLQVIQGQKFLGRSEGNHVRLKVEHAPRGVIYDRNGRVLAQNNPGFTLLIDQESLPSEKKDFVIGRISEIVQIKKEEIGKKLSSQYLPNQPTKIANNINPDQALEIETESSRLPGVVLEVNPIRHYPYGPVTAHLLGYTAEADENDLAKKIPIPYSLGDKVGKAGIEAEMEETLRGINGYKLEKVSATGERKGEIYGTNHKAGGDITLSIDIELQKFLYNNLKKQRKLFGVRGASAVVLNPNTGEVLAMVSLPGYDNNLFSKGITTKQYQSLISNRNRPLLNRAIGSSYPPGSTFKLISGSAGLEVGAISRNSVIVDSGYVQLGNIQFKNWLWIESRRTEGGINIVRALVRSTDTFFYEVGRRVGEKSLQKFAKLFGLGEKTGINLPDEISGLVPTEEWKLSVKSEPWYPGETLNMSIGQGDVLATPLQVANYASVFANGGKLVTPTILKTEKPNVIRENFLHKETIQTIREGMFESTYKQKIAGKYYAGKTGTAESGQVEPHAWYTSFAPYPRAELAVSVMFEHAGHGLVVSTPVAKLVYEWWFTHRKN